jgi:hypothetical protein
LPIVFVSPKSDLLQHNLQTGVWQSAIGPLSLQTFQRPGNISD